MRDTIDMAREAGDDWDSTLSTDKEFLKRFADLVRADERALAAQPAPVPLTNEQIDDLARTMVKSDKSVNWLARAIEAAHGITEKGQP